MLRCTSDATTLADEGGAGEARASRMATAIAAPRAAVPGASGSMALPPSREQPSSDDEEEVSEEDGEENGAALGMCAVM